MQVDKKGEILLLLSMFGACLLYKGVPNMADIRERAEYLYLHDAKFHKIVETIYERLVCLIEKEIRDARRNDSDSS